MRWTCNSTRESPDVGGEPASVTAATQLNANAHQVRLASLEAKYHGQTVKLLSPATVSFADGLSIGDLKLGAQQAVLEIDGRVSPSPGRARVAQTGEAGPHQCIRAGTAGERERFKPTRSYRGPRPPRRARCTWRRPAFAAPNDAARGLPAVDMHADAQLMENTAQVDAKLTAGSASHLSLTGKAPLAADGALDLKLAGNLDLGLAEPFVGSQRKARDRRVDGRYDRHRCDRGTRDRRHRETGERQRARLHPGNQPDRHHGRVHAAATEPCRSRVSRRRQLPAPCRSRARSASCSPISRSTSN